MKTFKTFDGLSLAYGDDGPRDGLPVLCLAGLTRDSRDFTYLAEHLGDVRLIRMDYRGRGQSDWAPDRSSYAISVESRDALALLDHLSLPAAAIIGTSRGGLIAMTLALTARTRVLGVCLNDIGPELDPLGLSRIFDYLGKRPAYATAEAMARDKPNTMIGFSGVPAARWLQEVQHQTVTRADGLDIPYDPALREAVLDASNPEQPVDLWPFFDALQGLPTGLIRGANSDLLSRETAQKMRARHPEMLFADIPDRGHVPFLDEPAALHLIRKWIDQCR